MNDTHSVIPAFVTLAAALCTLLVAQPAVALVCLLVVAAVWKWDGMRARNTAVNEAEANAQPGTEAYDAERVELLHGASTQTIRQLQGDMVQIRELIRSAVAELGQLLRWLSRRRPDPAVADGRGGAHPRQWLRRSRRRS